MSHQRGTALRGALWRTWPTTATQRPGRGVLLSGKLLAITTTLGIIAAFILAAGWISSLIVAGLLNESQAGPSALEVLAGWAAAWLVLTTYALIGALAAVAMRTTGLAIGAGLLYVLLFEQGLLTLPLPARAAELVAQATIGTNAFALAIIFIDQAPRPDMTVPPPRPTRQKRPDHPSRCGGC